MAVPKAQPPAPAPMPQETRQPTLVEKFAAMMPPAPPATQPLAPPPQIVLPEGLELVETRRDRVPLASVAESTEEAPPRRPRPPSIPEQPIPQEPLVQVETRK
jgi:hypothetical protein